MTLRSQIIQRLTADSHGISGQKLADEFQVSRNAIWKTIQQLKEDGYQIESDRASGYRLEEVSKRIDPALITPVLPNLVIEHQPVVTSTNDLAKEYIIAHPRDNYLLIADKQTQGRGRHGKSFQSDLSKGIYFTLAFKIGDYFPVEQLPLLTVLAATAIAQSLEEYLPDLVKIKWVNDLFYQKRKVAGILTEVTMDLESASASHVIVGIGINLAGKFEQVDESVQQVAGTIFGEHLPEDFNPNDLINLFLAQFNYYFSHFNEKRFMSEYQSRLLGLNHQLDYTLDGVKASGTIRGIDDSGHLLMENHQGEIKSLYGTDLSFTSMQFIEKGIL